VTEPEASAQPETAESPIAQDGDSAQSPEATTEPAAAETTNDPLFEALWAKVLSAWDDDKTHGAVLEYSVTSERLPDLAGRYRALKDDPERGERAKKRLDAIVLAATQLMMSMKTPVNTKVPLPITLTVFALFLCVVAFVGYAMVHGR
jgi:hypothetical protein